MTISDFNRILNQKIIILDGAMGTQLAANGMPFGVCPEQWILEHPAVLKSIQQKYLEAGAELLYVPSFGANRFKLEEFGLGHRISEINQELARLSKSIVGSKGYAFGDIAPTGHFVAPYGDLPFEEAVTVYKEQVAALLAGGVDGFIIETMMDIQETRAAVIAVKESCSLPIMASMTFDESMRTLSGNDPLSALITLQALGVAAFGCNCSTGPKNMVTLIKRIKPHATIPLLAKPNAGMPQLVGDQTVFDMTPEEFAGFAGELAQAGANLVGGCCGTTPEHIRALAGAIASCSPLPPQIEAISAVSSSRASCFFGPTEPFAIIGERINPTGKPALQAELREDKLGIVREMAANQAVQGAALLDVNVGLSGIDETSTMLKVITAACEVGATPLCIDSTNSEVMEAALRFYPGRALVNSISAEKSRIEEMLPIAARYGAMFVLLPLADSGIPETLAERIDLIKHVYDEAAKYGYTKLDIVVDCLIMTVSSNQQAAMLSLDTIEWSTREFGVSTVCGLSNVSFGMPQRNWINAGFLGMALGRGLNLAIANPESELLNGLISASDVVTGRDYKMRSYVARYGKSEVSGTGTSPVEKQKTLSPQQQVFNDVLEGNEEGIAQHITNALSAGISADALVDEHLIPAINRVGELYDSREYFLPQLIMSADTMRLGFETLEPHLTKQCADSRNKAVIVMATVEGDIHDIGKNIVILMLRNYGFEVVDLGKDVPASHIIEEAKKHGANIIGLSALMTTTMVKMTEVIKLARQEKLHDIKFIIGGAVVDQRYAELIGADAYAADAMEAVRIAKGLTIGNCGGHYICH